MIGERDDTLAIQTYKLRLISPAFIAGTDKNYPEMRAASVRGQLRYWLRAMLGAHNPNPKNVWETESQIFGSTTSGSGISVRVFRDGPAKSRDYPMLPHRKNEGRRGLSIQRALDAGQVYDLQLASRPGVKVPSEAVDALSLWSLLGGIGRRSRRMFGAVQIMAGDDNPNWYTQPQNPDELAALIRNLLTRVGSAPPQSNLPGFPTLNSAQSWVIVGKTPFSSSEDLVITLFRDLLRADAFRNKQDTFGQAMGGRRASPLIAQVRRIRFEGEDYYFPILTALRSRPDKNIDWSHLKRFMEAAESHFDAERVWGGW